MYFYNNDMARHLPTQFGEMARRKKAWAHEKSCHSTLWFSGDLSHVLWFFIDVRLELVKVRKKALTIRSDNIYIVFRSSK